MAVSAVSQNHGLNLILQRLIIAGYILRGINRIHGVGAAVTAGAVDAAVAFGIAVEDRTGIDLGDTTVAGHTLGLGYPGDSACRN